MVNFYSNVTVGNTTLISNLTTELQTAATDAVTSGGFGVNRAVIAKVAHAVFSQLFTPIGLALSLAAIGLFVAYKVRRYKQISAELEQLWDRLLKVEKAQPADRNNHHNQDIWSISNQIMDLYEKEISKSYLYQNSPRLTDIYCGAETRRNAISQRPLALRLWDVDA